jgi:hypothetical protein
MRASRYEYLLQGDFHKSFMDNYYRVSLMRAPCTFITGTVSERHNGRKLKTETTTSNVLYSTMGEAHKLNTY